MMLRKVMMEKVRAVTLREVKVVVQQYIECHFLSAVILIASNV